MKIRLIKKEVNILQNYEVSKLNKLYGDNKIFYQSHQKIRL